MKEPKSIKRPTKKLVAELLFLKRLSIEEIGKVFGKKSSAAYNLLKNYHFPSPKEVKFVWNLRERALTYLGEVKAKEYALDQSCLLCLPNADAILEEILRPFKNCLVELLVIKKQSIEEISQLLGKINIDTLYKFLQRFHLPMPRDIKVAWSRRELAFIYLGEVKAKEYALDRSHLLCLPNADAILKVISRPLKEVLEDLIFEKRLRLIEIRNLLGIDKVRLKKILEDLELPSPHQYKITMVRRRIIIDYLHLKPKARIGQKYKVDRSTTVPNILKSAGLEDNIDPGHVRNRMKTIWVPLPSEVEEIIQGFLLGDGHLRTTHSSNSLSLSEIPTDDEFLNAIETLYLFALTNNFPLYQLSPANAIFLPSPTVKAFNEAVVTIMKPSTSRFRLHKAPLEAPWVGFIGQFLQTNGCPYTFKPGYQKNENGIITDTEFNTIYTFQFDKIRRIWYINSDDRTVPRSLVLTPLMVLCLFIDDGNSSIKNGIRFCVEGLRKSDVQFLGRLLSREIGVPVNYRESANRLTIAIRFVDVFLDYLSLAPSTFLEVAKTCFPWKFDCSLTKQEIYDPKNSCVDENYFQRYMMLSKRIFGKDALIFARLTFPWKYKASPKSKNAT